MRKRMIETYKRFYKGEKGSFTIEASLTFPIIFLAILATIFFSIYVYQNVVLYTRASVLAERIASNWNNSYKDVLTGKLAIEDIEGDGLYWRLFRDFSADVDMNYDSSTKQFSMDAPSEMLGGHSQQKILNFSNQDVGGESFFPENIEGTVQYRNHLIKREIVVSLEGPVQLPILGFFIDDLNVMGEASATVTEPTEFMRTIDFINTYITGPAMEKSGINQWMDQINQIPGVKNR